MKFDLTSIQTSTHNQTQTMAKSNIQPLPVSALDCEDNFDQEHSRAAQLAWDYCSKIRFGQKPSKDDFYSLLPNAESKEEFDFLVGMNEFVEQAVEHQSVNNGP
jgi:hypothetical protein